MNASNLKFNEYVPSKKVISFLSEPHQQKYESGRYGRYFALGEYSDGMVQISENKSLDTMHFAQNWICKLENIVYE